MEGFMNFLVEYRFVIAYVILFGIAIYMNPAEFKARLYQGIVNAKKLAKDGVLKTGAEQEDWVVNNITSIIGKRFKPAVTILGEAQLRKIIHFLYDKAIKVLEDGSIK